MKIAGGEFRKIHMALSWAILNMQWNKCSLFEVVERKMQLQMSQYFAKRYGINIIGSINDNRSLMSYVAFFHCPANWRAFLVVNGHASVAYNIGHGDLLLAELAKKTKNTSSDAVRPALHTRKAHKLWNEGRRCARKFFSRQTLKANQLTILVHLQLLWFYNFIMTLTSKCYSICCRLVAIPMSSFDPQFDPHLGC